MQIFWTHTFLSYYFLTLPIQLGADTWYIVLVLFDSQGNVDTCLLKSNLWQDLAVALSSLFHSQKIKAAS